MLKSLCSVLLLGAVLCFSGEAFAQGGIRFVHASPHIDAVDFFLEGNLKVFEAVEPFSSSGVRDEFPPLEYSTSVKATGTADPIVAQGTATRVGGEISTVVLVGEPGSAALLPLQWNMETPPQGSIRIRLVHASSAEHGTIDAFLDDTRFLENVAQFDASGFTEVPIEQSESIEIRNSEGVLIGKFNGQFDPGNSYSLFFSSRQGQPVMHVLFENSLDPQLPLVEAESQGSLVPLRVINVASDVSSSFWNIGGQDLAESTGFLSASKEQAFLLSEENSTIGFANRSQGEAIDEVDIALPTQEAYAMFAVGSKGQERLVEGVLPPEAPASGRVAVRFLNALPAGQINVVLNNEQGVQVNLATHTLSGYVELESQVATFSVFSSSSQELLSEGRVGLESGKTYTLIVLNPESAAQIRILDESSVNAQIPMKVADAVISGAGMFRAVNLVQSDESILAFTNESNTINELVGLNSTSELKRNLPEGKQLVEVHSESDPDNAVASESVDIINEATTLCVAYGPDEDNTMLAYSTEVADRADAGSVNIRVFSAIDDDEPMLLWSSIANSTVVGGIRYGEFTGYSMVEYDPAMEFSLRKGATQLYNFALTEDYRRNMTFFVTRFEDQLTVMVLKEDEEGPQDPLMLTENLGIQSVEDLKRMYGFEVRLLGNEVSDKLNVEYTSEVPVHVQADIVALQGQVLAQYSQTRNVATQSIQTMPVTTLQPGVYILRLIVNDQLIGLPFIKQ